MNSMTKCLKRSCTLGNCGEVLQWIIFLQTLIISHGHTDIYNFIVKHINVYIYNILDSSKGSQRLAGDIPSWGLPWWLSGKESIYQCRRRRFDPWIGKGPWRSKWQPTPVFLPGKSHGQRSLVAYSPWGGSQRGLSN